MKNYLMFALLIGAATTMAFGQAGVADPAKISVNCPDANCHITQVFKGEGGFVGTKAADVDKVTFVVSCGSVSISGDATLNGDLATQALTDANGMSCHAEGGGSVEVQGLTDGGWYWITDDMNTAVANLLPKDAMNNTPTVAANPGGDDFDVTVGGTASYIKQKSTGRVGIVSHILPDPPTPAAPRCGPSGTTQDDTDCMLDSGKTRISLRGRTTGGQTGGVIDVVGQDNTVARNASDLAGGSYPLVMQLWDVEGQGRVAVGLTPVYKLGVYGATNPSYSASWKVKILNATPGNSNSDLQEAGLGDGGNTEDGSSDGAFDADNRGAGVLSGHVLIVRTADNQDANYCSGGNNKTVMLEITGTPTARAANVNEVLPAPQVAKRTISITCPAGTSSSQGQELVPDNLFPTTDR